MEKMKKKVLNEIKKSRKNISELYLMKGYDIAIENLEKILRELVVKDLTSQPTPLDLILDLDLVEDKKHKTISQEDAINLFYYKLGWNRGRNRSENELYLPLKKIG